MMTSHLPAKLVEEILSRVPATSLMRWRSICKRWSTLFEDQRFAEKHLRNAPKQPLVLMLDEYRLYLTSVDLSFVPPSIEFSDALSLKDYNISEDADIEEVFHCDGLLLCTTMDDELVVWNPCSGETRWIKQKDGTRWFPRKSKFALGYVNNQSRRIYKILMFRNLYDTRDDEYEKHQDQDYGFEIFDFNSNTWKVLNSPTCIKYWPRGVTLKGNTYWACSDGTEDCYLLSFDFTRERFIHLCFPITSQDCWYRSLSVVREELSVLCFIKDSTKIEMWVTNQIDTTTCEADLSWSKSFEVDYEFGIRNSLLIDEDKKVALCCDPCFAIFTIGEEGEYFTKVPFKGERFGHHRHIFSYVPSLVQIQQGIESDVFGNSRPRRWEDRRRRLVCRTNKWYYYIEKWRNERKSALQQEIAEYEEWYWWEIECTDFSSLCRSRGRGWKRR